MNGLSRSEIESLKAKAAKELARKHFEVEEGLETVVRLSGSADVEVLPAEPIKLLEVNSNTVPSGVMPIIFGPSPASGIPYSSIIIEVTPSEFGQIQRKELELPNGWEMAEVISRS